jgi:cell wall-associated NlpC family hydrolase
MATMKTSALFWFSWEVTHLKKRNLLAGALCLAGSLMFTVPVFAAPADAASGAAVENVEANAEQNETDITILYDPEVTLADEETESEAQTEAKEGTASELIKSETQAETADESEEESVTGETADTAVSTENKSLGSRVANFALQFVGNRYRYGGSSLTGGTDCSGFTMSVYQNFGISLPHSSRSQRGVGTAVGSLEEAQPGDLICYSGHVALYVGDGQVVHALNERKGIVTSAAAYQHILAIRRVI